MPGLPAPTHTSATSQVEEGITSGTGAPSPPNLISSHPHGMGIPTVSTIAPATAVSNLGGVVTPVNVFNLHCALQNHPSREFVNKLCFELREGARIGYSGRRQFRHHRSRANVCNLRKETTPYLKPCLLKACHVQVIKSTLFCLLILIWSRDRQFKFDPPGSIFGSKNFLTFTKFACLLSKQALANHKSNDVSFLN